MGRNLVNSASAPSESKSSQANTGRLSTLTNGMPNVNPPRGHMLRAVQLFSISLDSQLLELAQIGGGPTADGFIPDSGIVGTVFIHAVTNATYAPRAHLHVELPPDTETKVKSSPPS